MCREEMTGRFFCREKRVPVHICQYITSGFPISSNFVANWLITWSRSSSSEQVEGKIVDGCFDDNKRVAVIMLYLIRYVSVSALERIRFSISAIFYTT